MRPDGPGCAGPGRSLGLCEPSWPLSGPGNNGLGLGKALPWALINTLPGLSFALMGRAMLGQTLEELIPELMTHSRERRHPHWLGHDELGQGG